MSEKKRKQTGKEEKPIVIKLSEYRSIHVRRTNYEGRDGVDVRTYVTSDDYSGYTQKGIRIPVENARAVAEAILKVVP